MIIQVEDKQYDVKVATTDQEKKKGLQGVDSLKATHIHAKSVHLPTTIKYLDRETFSIDTVKANIENINYFDNRCVY